MDDVSSRGAVTCEAGRGTSDSPGSGPLHSPGRVCPESVALEERLNWPSTESSGKGCVAQ